MSKETAKFTKELEAYGDEGGGVEAGIMTDFAWTSLFRKLYSHEEKRRLK